MPDYIDRFGLQDANGDSKTYKIGLIVAIFNVGCAFGCIFLSKIADVYGRRIGLMFAMIVYIVGIIIQISAQSSWIQIVFGRLIAGFAVGTVSVLSPLFISETSPKAYRGTLVCCFQLCVTFGIFIGYCINYGTYHNFNDSRQWRISLGLSFAWAIFLFIGMVFLPESPRYLIEKGKIEEAKKSISFSNGVSPEEPGVYTEIQLIQSGIDRENLRGMHHGVSWLLVSQGYLCVL